MLNIKHLLKFHAYLNIPLTYEEAYELGKYALEGCRGNQLAQIQSIACLCALHTTALYKWSWKKTDEDFHGHNLPQDAAEQIAGICAAIFEHDLNVSLNGYLNPNVPYAMDNCGMGGDIVQTFNISTVSALIAASAGIPMCKHGSPGNTHNIGSSDFIAHYCLIDEMSSKKAVENCLERNNFAYTEACDVRYKLIHLQTHKIAQLPHMNDLIGPITNPLNPLKMTRRVLGVNHLIDPIIIARAYLLMNERSITNLQHAFFVRGFVDRQHSAGMDEVSICSGGTKVVELRNREIKEFFLIADDFGVDTVEPKAVTPIGDKGDYSLKILRGDDLNESHRVVLANASLLFYLAEKVSSFQEGYQLAQEYLCSGKAFQTMLNVREMLPKKIDKKE